MSFFPSSLSSWCSRTMFFPGLLAAALTLPYLFAFGFVHADFSVQLRIRDQSGLTETQVNAVRAKLLEIAHYRHENHAPCTPPHSILLIVGNLGQPRKRYSNSMSLNCPSMANTLSRHHTSSQRTLRSLLLLRSGSTYLVADTS
jgi:hypothetical protein